MGDVCGNYRVQRLCADALDLTIHLQGGYMGFPETPEMEINGNKPSKWNGIWDCSVVHRA